MNGATKTAEQTSEAISASPLILTQRALLGLFLVVIAAVIAQAFGQLHLPGSTGLWDGLVLVLAAASTVVSLAGQLPMQNVLLATAVVGGMGGVVHAVGAAAGIPFGPITYTSDAGLKSFSQMPWFIPLLWVVVILNARGVARLFLRPWRKLRVYGYWLFGFTTVLTLIFVLGLEPFATHARHYWIWHPTKLPIDWYGAPLTDFLGWVVSTVLILAFSTPALMKKRPARSYPEYHPLIVWTAIQILFVAGSMSQHLGTATLVSGIACVVVIPFAIRGAAW